MHRTVYTVQKATNCTEVYGASGHPVRTQTKFNQHSNAYAKVIYCGERVESMNVAGGHG